jgi:tetratricopeptide (TPR) repeat protein
MGVVYRALDKWNGAACAVKVLTASTNARRFLREARILARLTHPAIVRYIGHGVAPDGSLFLAMEWVDGIDLERRLEERALSVSETLEVARRITEALSVVHGAGVVHRDLKPSNVLLPQGSLSLAKLGDFGVAHLSRTRHATSTLTDTGTIVGTPAYLSPEQLRGAELDARADLFSLGCVLFECLSGRPAFYADSLLALFAKIALDPTPRVALLRPGLPAQLVTLIDALLEKDPDARPASSDEVLTALETASSSEPDTDDTAQVVIGTQERRLVPIVVCPNPEGATRLDATIDLPRATLDALANQAGMRLEVLADDSIIAVPELVNESPVEQALRAARLCKMLAETLLSRPVAIVTGRMVVSSGLSVSEVAGSALTLVSGAAPGSIMLDEGSAALLEARFSVKRDNGSLRLEHEKLEEHAPRRLLGRSTPFVGRQREFSLLVSTLEACIEERYARAMLVSGLPGIGKSRLLSELVADSRSRYGEDLRVLVARGDPALAGQPFSLIGNALRRSAKIRADDTVEVRLDKLNGLVERDGQAPPGMAAFLGEILGLDLPNSVDPRLRAARRDPPMMSALTREAFTGWVQRAAGTHGLLLALDDLHWADGPSVQLIDAALGAWPEIPLFVLALGRPEVREAYPRLFEMRDVAELKLGRLSKRASEELIRSVLGAAASEGLVAAIVERAEGNAFFLEELVRAGASGGLHGLPDTVLGVMESRLSDLENEARWVLRAASVFGETCWAGGVSSVLGNESAISDVAGWLDTLAAREILVINPASRFATEPEYAFRHGLLRDASYATFTAPDRQLAHRRAAGWLESHGEDAAVVLAAHWEQALEPSRAVNAYVRALEQALRSNDLGSVLQLAERAERTGASGEALGRVRLLESDAYTWMGTPDQALHAASQAIELLPRVSPNFHAAVASAVEAAVLLGQQEAVDRLLPELVRAPDATVEGGGESLIAALGRVASALVLLGRVQAAKALLADATQLAKVIPPMDGMTLAHLAHARAATAMMERDLEESALAFTAAADGFEQSGALRLASGARTNVAAVYLEMGAAEPALAALDSALVAAERSGARYTLGLAQLNRGIALTRLARIDEAVGVLGEARAEMERQGDRRLVASASCALAEALCDARLLAEAEAEARRAVAAAAGLASSSAAALATLAFVLLARNDASAALVTAREADVQRATTTMEERELLLDLVLAEAELEVGDAGSARDRLTRVAAELRARAERIQAPTLRQAFLQNVPEHRRLLELAHEQGAATHSNR